MPHKVGSSFMRGGSLLSAEEGMILISDEDDVIDSSVEAGLGTWSRVSGLVASPFEHGMIGAVSVTKSGVVESSAVDDIVEVC